MISEADPRMEGVEEEEEEEEGEERGTVAEVLLWRRVLVERLLLLLLLLPPRRGGSMVHEEELGGGRVLPRQMLWREKGRWSRTRALTVGKKTDEAQRKETSVVMSNGFELV